MKKLILLGLVSALAGSVANASSVMHVWGCEEVDGHRFVQVDFPMGSEDQDGESFLVSLWPSKFAAVTPRVFSVKGLKRSDGAILYTEKGVISLLVSTRRDEDTGRNLANLKVSVDGEKQASPFQCSRLR